MLGDLTGSIAILRYSCHVTTGSQRVAQKVCYMRFFVWDRADSESRTIRMLFLGLDGTAASGCSSSK